MANHPQRAPPFINLDNMPLEEQSALLRRCLEVLMDRYRRSEQVVSELSATNRELRSIMEMVSAAEAEAGLPVEGTAAGSSALSSAGSGEAPSAPNDVAEGASASASEPQLAHAMPKALAHAMPKAMTQAPEMNVGTTTGRHSGRRRHKKGVYRTD
mmetsp:Transcript_112678/g.251505  ORF Transcript_112678/g.251505 Transcript_112678/m.251505 type:complete len:156 (+) Transcript_112678:89-556(+)